MYACEITDHDETLGGKTIRLGFATKQDAENCGKKEVKDAAEIFIDDTLITFRVYETV